MLLLFPIPNFAWHKCLCPVEYKLGEQDPILGIFSAASWGLLGLCRLDS